MTTDSSAEPVERLERRRFRVGNDLRDSVMIAQVDEQHAAVVALAVDPAGKADGLADVGSAELAAIMGAIRVHLPADSDVRKFAAALTGAKPFVNPRDRPLMAAADSCDIHPLITRSEDLVPLVERLSKQPFVAVDTEFMRENTYWPDLCLIQIASREEAAAIDPKADIDLAPLLDAAGRQSGSAEGLPRRRPGPRNHLQSDRQDPLAAVRHADRGDGARARRAGRLFEPHRNGCSATTSTRARASPTGAAGRSTSGRSIMRSPTSPISRRSSRSC